jgi:hypothetical protein
MRWHPRDELFDCRPRWMIMLLLADLVCLSAAADLRIDRGSAPASLANKHESTTLVDRSSGPASEQTPQTSARPYLPTDKNKRQHS